MSTGTSTPRFYQNLSLCFYREAVSCFFIILYFLAHSHKAIMSVHLALLLSAKALALLFEEITTLIVVTKNVTSNVRIFIEEHASLPTMYSAV